MKRLLSICIVSVALFVQQACFALEQMEAKERAAEQIPVTILRKNRVQFYTDDTLVGPFDLKGVKTDDTAKILDHAQIGDKNVVAGIIYKVLPKADDRVFIIEFDKDWKSPRVVYNNTLEKIALSLKMPEDEASKFNKGDEWLKIFPVRSYSADYYTYTQTYSVIVLASNRLYGYYYFFRFNPLQKNWGDQYFGYQLFEDQDYRPLPGYEEAIITKIHKVSLKPTDILGIWDVTINVEAKGVKPGYPTTITATRQVVTAI